MNSALIRKDSVCQSKIWPLKLFTYLAFVLYHSDYWIVQNELIVSRCHLQNCYADLEQMLLLAEQVLRDVITCSELSLVVSL